MLAQGGGGYLFSSEHLHCHTINANCTRLGNPGKHVSLDYTAHEADSDDNYAEQDDNTVEKILAQRPNASVAGGVEFRVRWRGYRPSNDTWEPVSSFVPQINSTLMTQGASSQHCPCCPSRFP